MGDLLVVGLGFFIVVGVLIMLWGVCALVGFGFKLNEKMAAKKAKPVAAPTPQAIAQPPTLAPASTASGESIPPHHLAAITAAVAAAGQGRILTISAPAHFQHGWLAGGRMMQTNHQQSRGEWASHGPPMPFKKMIDPVRKH